ncbi:MAG: hypothetical protein WD875_11540 [Pirellulales bacterium]
MQIRRVFLASLGIALTAWAANAQSTADENVERQIAELKSQLDRLERLHHASAGIRTIRGSRQDGDGKTTSVRIYEVGDLFATPPSHPANYDSDLTRTGKLILPAVGEDKNNDDDAYGGGGAGFNIPEGAEIDSQMAIDELIEAIQAAIAPMSWSVVGGDHTITQLGSSLVISTDGETHDQIADFVAALRKNRDAKRTVSVRSYWLWLSDAKLAELVADDAAEGKIRDAKHAFGLVDAAAFDKHVAALQKDDEARAGYRSAITCFDGQTVHTASGRQSIVVTGFIPVVGDETSVLFRPVHSLVQEGAVLQVTPRVSTSGDAVILDVRSRVCLRDPVDDPADDKKAAKESLHLGTRRIAAMIERRSLRVHRLSTMIRAPLDRPILVGGMTNGEESKPGEPNLYLFVNVAVQGPRDDDRDASVTDAATADRTAAHP